MSVFDLTQTNRDSTNHKLFLDDSVTIARYDRQKYPFLEKLTEKQLGFFWVPQEVDLVKDQRDFKSLTDHEQHIFTSNIKRQIILDSVQGRAPFAAFGPVCSLPELESWLLAWSFSELIHSRSYTHIIRNVYPDPSKVFDGIMDIQEIVDCAKDISQHYDKLIALNIIRELKKPSIWTRFLTFITGPSSWLRVVCGLRDDSLPANAPPSFNDNLKYEHKKAIWLTLMSVNILEGVRFYVSFACSWAFAELKKMEGNSKIIKLICRDENLHLAGTQQLLKTLPKDDPDFIQIVQETQDEVVNLFTQAVEQEKAWAHYLFKDGSMIGLNEQLLVDYIEWIAHKRMLALELPSPYKGGPNPLPWTQKWIAGQEVQVAPQETEVQSYVIGGIQKDVTEGTFKGFKL